MSDDDPRHYIPAPSDYDLETFPRSMELRDCLSRLPVRQLDGIFEHIGFDERPSRRGEREEWIADFLERPDNIVTLLEHHLEDEQLEVLEYLAGFDEDIPAGQLLADGLVGEWSGWLDFGAAGPLGDLRRLGLVHVGTHSVDGREYVFVGVPVEVREVVEQWVDQVVAAGPGSVAQLADHLLADPPMSAPELEDRLAGFERWELQDELLDRIGQGRLDKPEIFGLVETFSHLAPEQVAAELEDIIHDPPPEDPDNHRMARIAAHAVWSLQAPEHPADQVDMLELPAEKIYELAEAGYEILLEVSDRNPMLARMPGEQLLETPPDQRRAMFDEIERLRKKSGTGAGRMYATVLADPGYRELWPLVAEGVLEDRHPADAWLIEQCARRTDEADAAASLRKTAMQLRSKDRPDESAPEGVAMMGGCDGEGALSISGCIELGDGNYSFVNVVLRAGSRRLREGFVMPQVSERELESVVDQIESRGGSRLARVPLPVAAGLVHEAARRATDREEAFDFEILEAAHRFQRLPAEPLPELDRDPEVEYDRQDVAGLLSNPPLNTWVFGIAELLDADLMPLPDPASIDETWVEQAASALGQLDGTRRKVVAQCEHMALWSHFREGANTEALFGDLADRTEASFADSPLVLEMTRRTPAFYEGRPEFGELAAFRRGSNPDLEEALAERFFPAPGHLDERDERRLEIMELLFSTLDFVRPAIPADHRPRYEQIYTATERLGTRVAEIEASGENIDRPGLREVIEERLDDWEWPETRPEIVYPELVENLWAEIRL